MSWHSTDGKGHQKKGYHEMKKYAIPATLLLLGNEIISLAMLTVMVFMFIADVMKGAPTP